MGSLKKWISRLLQPEAPSHQVSIVFDCGATDDPLEVQLEPEAIVFRVLPGNSLTFTANCPGAGFSWAVRVTHSDKSIQLMPAGGWPGETLIFENGILLKDWHKYM